MQNLITAMRETFPTLADDALKPELRLCDCPSWDSMTAVNLLMEVEKACGVTMGSYEPTDSTTLADLAVAIAAAGGKP